MKTLAAALALALLAIIFVGYYDALDDADINRVFFIKKAPTWQVEFRNLFANDADDKPLERLTPEERDEVIAYCRYRLGITTELNTQAELERCKPR
ncbi:hypothetical protein VUJ49_09225 [Pseudomonas berkeleyensis]|uniref:Uncharacterized protein n=1 Tax=Pseudomonas berkeleyensis TaxID=2726956 RepID=A0A7G5DTY9_9PSED|nr:hypothetical protein [Pseudomonas berkeleyensis]QMV65214.1 hypothetical protein HS968_09190 [Pseudomonas berkeleyensis]WSO40691.1 hypothetical protein VUJ49_09225 [Pseudomonas berkeleyensis]